MRRISSFKMSHSFHHLNISFTHDHVEIFPRGRRRENAYPVARIAQIVKLCGSARCAPLLPPPLRPVIRVIAFFRRAKIGVSSRFPRGESGNLARVLGDPPRGETSSGERENSIDRGELLSHFRGSRESCRSRDKVHRVSSTVGRRSRMSNSSSRETQRQSSLRCRSSSA